MPASPAAGPGPPRGGGFRPVWLAVDEHVVGLVRDVDDRGGLRCDLVAVARNGERRVVMGWLVPAAGYGVPGHPGHLVLQGGTSIPKNDLTRVDVDVVRGRTLLSIPL